MSAFARFISNGLAEADRRVATALSTPELADADRYLFDSVIVRTIDSITMRVQGWWAASAARGYTLNFGEAFGGSSWADRYQSIAAILMTAVTVHVVLTLMQGPRPGWFWIVIPSMAAVFAAFALVAARSKS
jgi:hypothetical protein